MIPAVATTPDMTVRPMRERAVTRCARSAHTRPIRTVLSKVVSWRRLANEAAARRRWIFWWAVSLLEVGGAEFPEVKSIREDVVADVLEA